jgi:hypothetical protein
MGGVAKGLTNIAGPAVSVPGPFGGHHTFIDPKNSFIANPSAAAYVRRHEADEARSSTNMKKKYGSRGIMAVRTGDELTGQHASPRVLKREKGLVDTHTNLYGDKNLKKLIDYRKNSGEYNAVDKLSGSQIRRIEKQVSKQSPDLGERILSAYKEAFKAHLRGENQQQAIRNLKMGYQFYTKGKKITPEQRAILDKEIHNQFLNRLRRRKLTKVGVGFTAAALVGKKLYDRRKEKLAVKN